MHFKTVVSFFSGFSVVRCGRKKVFMARGVGRNDYTDLKIPEKKPGCLFQCYFSCTIFNCYIL